MKSVTLITGGGRSGKSTFALTMTNDYVRKAFIATATACDEEMRERIERHKLERSGAFVTIEEPLDLSRAVQALGTGFDAAVIDCLPVWIGNCLYEADGDIDTRIDAFVARIEAPPCDLYIVTNEVGMGIVPDNALARRYRDILGSLNQRIAALAHQVILMVCGMPVYLKSRYAAMNLQRLTGEPDLMNDVQEVIASIKAVDQTIASSVQAHLDCLTKPQGSLGRLEEIALRYCLITGTASPVLGRKRIVTFAGDHGVAGEGVSAFPQAVTPQMVRNMLAGGAAVNVLARHAGIEVRVVDIGVADPLDDAQGLIRKKIRPGTRNMAQVPAMTDEETLRALQVGIDLADEASGDGVTLIGTGDMGIANTTPSSALFAALLPCDVELMTGRGTGIDDAVLEKKIRVIRQALDLHRERLKSPLGALAAVGGFEIAGICGLILGCAAKRIPVVVDGFISSAAALVACAMCGNVKDYLFFSHCSHERGHREFFRKAGVSAILDFGMRLGEGSGAAVAMPIIEGALKVYNEMATFSSAGVDEKSS